MTNKFSIFAALISISLLMTSCEAIGAIFKTGVWTGVILVALIIALVVFIARSLGGKK